METREEIIKKQEEQSDLSEVVGYGLILTAFCFFIFTMYSLIISKFMPDTGHIILDWFKQDKLYVIGYLSLIPISFVVMYIHWQFQKLFRNI